MYTQFSGINFGVHGCGTGREPSLLGGRVMDVPAKGGSLSSSGNNCVDVSHPCGVSVVYWWSVAGLVPSARDGRSGFGPGWGVGGPVWGSMAPIAGL